MMNLRSARSVCGATPKSQPSTRWGGQRWVSQRRVVALLLATLVSRTGHAAGTTATPYIHEDRATPTRIPDASWDERLRACEGETPGKSPLQIALRHYVKGADPIPRRFLTTVGNDSAVSEMGTKVLAEFGPTYYYAGSETAKAALREKLERVGPYPALLVVVRTDKKLNATTQIVRLGGHYITGEFNGKLALSRQYTISCGTSGWVIKDTKEEPPK
ncbi:MAG: hypothetical protein ABI852_03250 [Gemmatimonadaceae bacterium]